MSDIDPALPGLNMASSLKFDGVHRLARHFNLRPSASHWRRIGLSILSENLVLRPDSSRKDHDA